MNDEGWGIEIARPGEFGGCYKTTSSGEKVNVGFCGVDHATAGDMHINYPGLDSESSGVATENGSLHWGFGGFWAE